MAALALVAMLALLLAFRLLQEQDPHCGRSLNLPKVHPAARDGQLGLRLLPDCADQGQEQQEQELERHKGVRPPCKSEP